MPRKVERLDMGPRTGQLLGPEWLGWGGGKLGVLQTPPSLPWVLSFQCGPGRREKERGDVSLFNCTQSWLSGLANCYSISFSMILMRTVIAPTCQLTRDSCSSCNQKIWQKIPTQPQLVALLACSSDVDASLPFLLAHTIHLSSTGWNRATEK